MDPLVGMAIFFWGLALIPFIIAVAAPNTRKSVSLVCVLICLLMFPTSFKKFSMFIIAALPLMLLKLEALRLHESGRVTLAKRLPWLGLLMPILIITQIVRPEKFGLTMIVLWVLSFTFLAWCILIRFGTKFLDVHFPIVKKLLGDKPAKGEKLDLEI